MPVCSHAKLQWQDHPSLRPPDHLRRKMQINSRAEALQGAVDDEIRTRTKDLILLVDGQLYTLQLGITDLDLSPVAWILRAQRGTLEKFQTLLPMASQESSLGLVALARNLFENLVWLKHFNEDVAYGLKFYRDLLEQQQQSQRQAIQQATGESVWFDELEKEDGVDLTPVQHLIEKTDDLTDEEKALLREQLNAKSAAVDAKAAERFSIYAHQAKSNSYGYHAHLIRSEIIPHHEERLRVVQRHLTKLKALLPTLLAESQIELITKSWNWRERAKAVKMENQYDFIYSFTSKLLHSSAMNLITEKELQPSEREILLDYLRVCVKDAHREIDRFTYPGQVKVRALQVAIT